MTRTNVPERITVAVDALRLRGGERVLEVGCGRGVAAELICRRLDRGQLVGLDRSGKAITAARARNAAHLTAGRARFLVGSLAEADPADLGTFDVVLAVNVNVFWTSPARRELARVAALLGASGRFVLGFDPPDPEQLRAIEFTIVRHLRESGFRVEEVRSSGTERSVLVVVAAPT